MGFDQYNGNQMVNDDRLMKILFYAGLFMGLCFAVASFVHTMNFSAKFFYGNVIIGGLVALVLDGGVIVLSLQEGYNRLMKAAKFSTNSIKWLVFIYIGWANALESFNSLYGVEMSIDAVVLHMNVIAGISWVLASAVPPFLAKMIFDGLSNLLLKFLHEKNIQAEQRKADSAFDPRKASIAEIEEYLRRMNITPTNETVAALIGITERQVRNRRAAERVEPEKEAARNNGSARPDFIKEVQNGLAG